ncbi:hypothetical protein BGX26_005959 [Mortierella sp. AD094]|nr:hypothetical protein BGX26_005959 [Mortierella sp. AD094]
MLLLEQDQQQNDFTASVMDNNIQDIKGSHLALARPSASVTVALNHCHHNDGNVGNIVIVGDANNHTSVLGESVVSNDNNTKTTIDGEHVVCSTSLDRVRDDSRVTMIQSTDTHVSSVAIGSSPDSCTTATVSPFPQSKSESVVTETHGQYDAGNPEQEQNGDQEMELNKNKDMQHPSDDDSSFSSGQRLKHPHITYPNILQTLGSNNSDEITDSVMVSSVGANNATDSSPTTELVDVDLALRISHPQTTSNNNTERYSSSERPPYMGWSLQNNRTCLRDNNTSDQDSDDAGNGGSDEVEESSSSSSDSETERRWITESHRSLSMKRRKVSEDEEEEDDEEENEMRVSRPRNDIRSKASFAEASTLHVVHTDQAQQQSPAELSIQQQQQQQQQQRPSSWPVRKRRSILTESLPSFSEASQQVDPVGSNSNIDTSSLSLLSATSELVSTGAIPALTKGSSEPMQPVLATPSVLPLSSSSSPLPLSSTSALPETQFSFEFDSFTFSGVNNFNSNNDAFTPTTTSSSSMKKRGPGSSSLHKRRHNYPLFLKACRKRSFEDAIELGRPLGKDPSVELHRGCWFGSIKRRKIHHFPTLWTSTLSPSPYVKLMAMRDFWDVMKSRLDLSWLDLWTVTTSKWQGFEKIIVEEEAETEGEMEEHCNKEVVGATTKSTDFMTGTDREQKMELDCEAGLSKKSEEMYSTESPTSHLKAHRRRTLVQHPSTSLFLRGLWEEEERSRRQRQMIPECVHRPMRSKILNRKPIPKMNVVKSQNNAASWIIPAKAAAGDTTTTTTTLSPSSSSSSLSYASDSSDQTMVDFDDEDGFTKASTDSNQESLKEQQPQPSQQQQTQADQEMVVKKGRGPSAAIRSNALADGYDFSEYKHWKDGTISPHEGYIGGLSEMRKTMLHPWPAEESRAKDECTRMLHRMREQLNVVINLQIYLRTTMKTSPSQTSFMLSIRHPGEVSVEVLNELYGPQFLQTSAFRSIERLLWDKSPPPRVEDHHEQQQQQQQHSNQSYNAPSHSYSYTHSQASEYQFQDRDYEYEDGPVSTSSITSITSNITMINSIIINTSITSISISVIIIITNIIIIITSITIITITITVAKTTMAVNLKKSLIISLKIPC